MEINTQQPDLLNIMSDDVDPRLTSLREIRYYNDPNQAEVIAYTLHGPITGRHPLLREDYTEYVEQQKGRGDKNYELFKERRWLSSLLFEEQATDADIQDLPSFVDRCKKGEQIVDIDLILLLTNSQGLFYSAHKAENESLRQDQLEQVLYNLDEITRKINDSEHPIPIASATALKLRAHCLHDLGEYESDTKKLIVTKLAIADLHLAQQQIRLAMTNDPEFKSLKEIERLVGYFKGVYHDEQLTLEQSMFDDSKQSLTILRSAA